jgi:hypothetical protein
MFFAGRKTNLFQIRSRKNADFKAWKAQPFRLEMSGSVSGSRPGECSPMAEWEHDGLIKQRWRSMQRHISPSCW